MNSPAFIIQHLLIASGHGTALGVWPIYVSFLPDPGPDSAICIYDTVGMNDGRIMATGERIEHPGIQIYVRALTYLDAWVKARAIAVRLDEVRRVSVAIAGDTTYIVHNVSRTSPILALGTEQEGDRRRQQFTINAVTTLSEMVDGEWLPFAVAGGGLFYVQG